MTHIDYHVVLETVRKHQDQCPLCAFTARAQKSFFDSMLYSWVGTEGFQDRFLAADGFCPGHAHRLGELNDGVAVAMLYAPLLQHRRRWLKRAGHGTVARLFRRLASYRDRSAQTRGERAAPDACPLCDQISLWEHQFLRNLVRHAQDADLKDVFCAGSALCLPHYRLLITGIGRVPQWIREHQDARMDELAHAVDAFVGGKTGGVGGRDSTIWKDLLRFMEGGPGAIRRGGPRGRLRS